MLNVKYCKNVDETEVRQTAHTFIFVDEAGIQPGKHMPHGKKCDWTESSHRCPGQRGANITMRAALSNDGLILHKQLIAPYNRGAHLFLG